MTTDISSIHDEALAEIAATSSSEDLLTLEKKYFGRKSGIITELMKQMRNCSPEEKKARGKEVNICKQEIEVAIRQKAAELQQSKLGNLAETDVIDLTMDLPQKESGHLHPVHEFIRQVEEVFGRMGFDTAYGPEIENEEYNFDLLNFPREHAARDWADIFYMTKGGTPQSDSVRRGTPDNRMLLRGHTSPVQIRYMQKRKPPFRMICPGKVYRKDADATHSPMFHQFEGLMIGKDISLRHLKGVMEAAVKELVSPDLTFRFRTGFFPFTEPSMEMDIQWHGEEQTKEGRWLEVAGCGMVDPSVLTNVGIDPNEWQGFAFGFGVERLIMIKHQIPNIKLFYQGDVRFLKQF